MDVQRDGTRLLLDASARGREPETFIVGGSRMKPIGDVHRVLLASTLMLALPLAAQQPADSPTAPAEAAPAPATESPASSDAIGSAANTPARSEVMRLATSQALILDFAEAGSRAIAVGERGQILLSESRRDWRQVADVPTRANLTAVTAVGDLAWAVGHDGTILHSADGGQTWSVQRSDPWQPLTDDMEFNPRQGVPLLDVLMLDAQNGLAVGAYSLLLRTTDGGQTWNEVLINTGDGAASAGDALADDSAVADAGEGADAAAVEGEEDWSFSDADLELDEETDPHLNAITRTGDGALFIVAERGAAFRSTDDGATWERLQLPYEGSMFGVLGYPGQRVIAFGMRGNAFESNDLGATWDTIDTGTELSLMSGAALPDGGAVLVGANGIVLIRDAGGNVAKHTFQNSAQETPVLASVLAQSASELVVGGEKGVGQFQVQAQAPVQAQ
jgi:photosystem II stability/assembly factor-like uncharacterized protein